MANRFHLSEGDRLGWSCLSTILDDFSRYIVGWKLCTNMKVGDVTDTLNIALSASGCDSVKLEHKPRLLSDNGGCYIAEDLADWLKDRKMEQLHGAPGHPQTQGKVEHKPRLLSDNGGSPQCPIRASTFGIKFATIPNPSVLDSDA